jgi:hypothetical protein
LYSFYVLSKGNEIYERLVCIKAYVVCRRFSKPSRISSLILNTLHLNNIPLNDEEDDWMKMSAEYAATSHPGEKPAYKVEYAMPVGRAHHFPELPFN